MTIKKLGIYSIGGKRYIATGIKRGIVYEFRSCQTLKLVYYPNTKEVKALYEGNTQVVRGSLM